MNFLYRKASFISSKDSGKIVITKALFKKHQFEEADFEKTEECSLHFEAFEKSMTKKMVFFQQSLI